jgi:polyisoprenoid-binding protein YceI
MLMSFVKLPAVTLGIVLAASAAFAADTYKVDPAHTTVGFSISHLVINTVHGRFKDVAGSVTIDPDKSNAVVEANAILQTKSIDTGVTQRDTHLKSPDFFDAEKFPTITFASKRVENQGGQQMLVGDFTMHGVTREISLPVKIKGPITAMGGQRIGVEAMGSLNRKEYGLTWNRALEAGGVMVGEDVAIEINAEAVKTQPASTK